MVSLWSDEFTNALPCSTRWNGRATVGLEKLLAALSQLEPQPIVLDLHESLPATLHATRRVRVAYNTSQPFGYAHLEFKL
jgi:hypothetical protein